MSDPNEAQQAIAAALARIEAQQATLAADMAAMRLHVEGKGRRDYLLRELAGALGLSGTWASAGAISLVLAGVRRPPPGAAAVVAALAGTRLSPRQILRILNVGAAAETADKARALCQWWPPRDDGGIPTNEDCNAR